LKELLDQAEFEDQRSSRTLRRLRDLAEGNLITYLRHCSVYQQTCTHYQREKSNIGRSSSSSRRDDAQHIQYGGYIHGRLSAIFGKLGFRVYKETRPPHVTKTETIPVSIQKIARQSPRHATESETRESLWKTNAWDIFSAGYFRGKQAPTIHHRSKLNIEISRRHGCKRSVLSM